MRLRLDPSQKQTQRQKLINTSAAVLLFFAAIFFVEVDTGDINYNWKAHVHIESKATQAMESSTETRILQLEEKQRQLLQKMAKGKDEKEVEELKKELSLQRSLKDYQEKLKLLDKTKSTQKYKLEQKLQSLELELQKFNKQIHE